MFSQQIADEICERLMEGASLRQICRDPDMPSRSAVRREMEADAEFEAKCARARVIQADTLEDEMADIEDLTLSGDIKADVARVVLSSKQWRAAKMAPKKYGDRVEQVHSGTVAVESIRRTVYDPLTVTDVTPRIEG